MVLSKLSITGLALLICCSPLCDGVAAQIQSDDLAGLSGDERIQRIIDEEIIVKADPYAQYLPGRLGRGFAAFKAGRYDLAETHFDHVATIERNQRRINNQFLDQLSQGTSRSLNQTGIIELQDGSSLGSLYYMEGVSQARLGKIDAAKTSLRSAIRADRHLYDARADYAILELATGNFKKADKQINKLAKLLKKCERRGDDCDYRAKLADRLERLNGLKALFLEDNPDLAD